MLLFETREKSNLQKQKTCGIHLKLKDHFLKKR